VAQLATDAAAQGLGVTADAAANPGAPSVVQAMMA
jgi:hypothetical protein